MKVWYDHGIHLKIDNKHILLDPFKKATKGFDFVLVSHGHWDHASGLNKMENTRMIMHKATYEYKMDYIDKSNEIEFISDGETIEIDGIKVEGYRSAHCLGSLQFKIVGKEGTVIFTGDLNVGGTYVEAPPPILEGDILIIESNFGHPQYNFPDRLETLGRMGHWIHRYLDKKPVVLFSHALGKTQELTAFLNDMGILQSGGNGTRCNLFMQRLGVFTNQLFEKYRFRFAERYRLFNKSIELERNEILIYPIRERPSITHINDTKENLNLDDVAFGYVSGWTMVKHGDFYFPISSHSGYDELVEYVKKSGASKIYTFHGYSETFAKELRGLGFDATAITNDSSFD